MTLSREQIWDIRDQIREIVKGETQISGPIVRAAEEVAVALDLLDACLAREGLKLIYHDMPPATAHGQERH